MVSAFITFIGYIVWAVVFVVSLAYMFLRALVPFLILLTYLKVSS